MCDGRLVMVAESDARVRFPRPITLSHGESRLGDAGPCLSAAKRGLQPRHLRARVERATMLPGGRCLGVDPLDRARSPPRRSEPGPLAPGGARASDIRGARSISASSSASWRRASLSDSIQGGAAPALRSIRWAIAHSPAAESSSSGSRSPWYGRSSKAPSSIASRICRSTRLSHAAPSAAGPRRRVRCGLTARS